MRSALLLTTLVALAGCNPAPMNPSFPLTVKEANAELAEMAEAPKPLSRPVVIIGGYADPGFAVESLHDGLTEVVDDDRFLKHTVKADGFEEGREQLVAAVNERFASDDPDATVEVDVIGNSMGGLMAMYAADPDTPAPRLRIARLLTIATPFRGAKMAKGAPGGPIVKDMRPGSAFLAQLHRPDVPHRYTVIPYVRLDDAVVGPANAAPPQQTPWWVPNQPLALSHLGAYSDRRIVADIARRLREETPYTTEPRAALPAD